MTEIWKDIEGYGGDYQISNLGRVKSLKYNNRILKPRLDQRSGYSTIRLFCENDCGCCYVHRLVATAFIPNPESKPQVNHLNGVKTDNRVDNLEWVTAAENARHAVVTGLLKTAGEDNPRAKLTNEQAHYIRENPNGLMGFELASKFDVDPSVISDVQIGNTYKNAGGKLRPSGIQQHKIPGEVREEIRRLYVKGSRKFGLVGLAKRFNCSKATIWNIVNGK